MEDKEYIICAAIWYKEFPKHNLKCINTPEDGLVVTGWRHANIIDTVFALTNKPSTEKHSGKMIQGFLTNKNRFVDRIEAGKIAFDAGQIKKPSDYLFSEDLY